MKQREISANTSTSWIENFLLAHKADRYRKPLTRREKQFMPRGWQPRISNNPQPNEQPARRQLNRIGFACEMGSSGEEKKCVQIGTSWSKGWTTRVNLLWPLGCPYAHRHFNGLSLWHLTQYGGVPKNKMRPQTTNGFRIMFSFPVIFCSFRFFF